MDIAAFRDELRLKLTGGVLELELDDATIDKIINSAFRELQRYIDTTRLATISYSPCIDLSEHKVSSVSRVFRAQGYLSNGNTLTDGTRMDPMQVAQWQMLTGANGLSNDWVLNYGT